ncbi:MULTISPECIES: DUF6284 family protein [Catenuloplanes]|uniref:Uncharacterized protein n=1 Tax=Catenuloplanes niger TaxID=587534 RepID=A0AAE3ZQU6_9ACTN|nr:DUF6284 family protein [Catenuloplanes niger]MDR7323289.1 hypothetical protein [Catenuloplanes niger]
MSTNNQRFADGEPGPTPEHLTAIEREWPLIEAEMELVRAEIQVLTTEPRPTAIDWRRLRLAERRVLHEAAILVARLTESTDRAA